MDDEDLQSSVLGCLTIVCRLDAEVAFINTNDLRKCGESADGGNRVIQCLVAESVCAPVVLQILVCSSTTRSFIIRMTAARRRSFNHSQTFLTGYIASKSCNAGVNLALLTI